MQRQQQQQQGGEGLPTKMYAIQASAFEARQTFTPIKTNSTPNSPPTFTPLDLSSICAEKRKVVSNLPKNCGHCDAPLKKESYVERPNGAIYLYCKESNCSRSQVIFTPPDLTVPEYFKTCPWNPPPLPKAASYDPNTNMPLDKDGNLDSHVLHQIHPAGTKCLTCGEGENVHHKDCDTNGWYEAGRKRATMPDNWPKYDPSTFSWN